jgi:hypothetical protein
MIPKRMIFRMPDITLDNIKDYYGIMTPSEEQVDQDLPIPLQEFIVLKAGLLQGLVFRIDKVLLENTEELTIDYTVIGNYGEDDLSGLFTHNVKYFNDLVNLIVIDMMIEGRYVAEDHVMPVEGTDFLQDAEGDFEVIEDDFPNVPLA